MNQYNFNLGNKANKLSKKAKSRNKRLTKTYNNSIDRNTCLENSNNQQKKKESENLYFSINDSIKPGKSKFILTNILGNSRFDLKSSNLNFTLDLKVKDKSNKVKQWKETLDKYLNEDQVEVGSKSGDKQPVQEIKSESHNSSVSENKKNDKNPISKK